MPCQEIKSWAFDELVGAYLDLAIAYSLLCASTFAFFAEKFLGLFGLRLPCPCNGLFGDHNRNKCWRRVLADRPSENISSVLFSAKSRFPFDSMGDKHLNFESSVGTINEVNCGSDNGGLEGEAWCGSLRERKSGKGVERSVVNVRDVKEGKLDVKERGFLIQKGRYLRRRRQVAADKGLFSSVSSYDHSQSNSRTHLQSPASVNKLMNKDHEGDMVPASSGAGALHFEDSKESSVDTGFVGTVCNDFESNELLYENKPMEKAALPGDDSKCNAHGEPCFDGEEKHGIRVLEQASEEEHAACSALYLELEKERSAAATAADEAMAMILRLQEEKALIEMEARQYHRMIEEKSAYDLEEMNILKEILLRREREKHFLEKEVETYRQVIFGNEELESDVQDIGTMHEQRASSSQYSHEDPFLVLQRISESIDEKEKGEESNKFLRSKVQSIESQSCALAFGKELPIPELDEDESLKGGCIHRHPGIDKLRQHLSMDNDGTEDECEEKELLSPDNSLFDQLREPQIMESCSQFDLSTRGCNLNEKTISTSVEAQQRSDCINAGHELASKTTETCDQTKIIFPYSCDDSEKHARDSSDAEFDLGSLVHVIDDKTNLSCGINENGSEKLSMSAASDIPRTCGSPRISWAEQDVRKSCSDMTNGLPPLGSSKGKFLTSDLRRNSMSAVDYERYKIDSEVGWLRERLRIIQVGREQLNISMENREKKKFQLQHLENTVSQLREIQQSTEHGKAARQASLPPLSYKVMSKKRQWRSASLRVHRST